MPRSRLQRLSASRKARPRGARAPHRRSHRTPPCSRVTTLQLRGGAVLCSGPGPLPVRYTSCLFVCLLVCPRASIGRASAWAPAHVPRAIGRMHMHIPMARRKLFSRAGLKCGFTVGQSPYLTLVRAVMDSPRRGQAGAVRVFDTATWRECGPEMIVPDVNWAVTSTDATRDDSRELASTMTPVRAQPCVRWVRRAHTAAVSGAPAGRAHFQSRWRVEARWRRRRRGREN